MNNEHADWEDLGGGIKIQISPAHTFGTDAFLLSNFANIRRKDTACDFGTGCGIIPLLWMRSAETTPQKVWAVDIQPLAIAQLEESVAQSGLAGRVIPLLADLREGLLQIPAGSLELVTCNPPYKAMESGILSEGDSDRIARHETMCTMQDVCTTAARLLKFGGRLCLCQRPERLVDAMEAMRKSGIEPKRLRFVQKHADTAPWLFLLEGKRGAKPFLQVEPPFVVHSGDGVSDEMKRLYQLYGKV